MGKQTGVCACISVSHFYSNAPTDSKYLTWPNYTIITARLEFVFHILGKEMRFSISRKC